MSRDTPRLRGLASTSVKVPLCPGDRKVPEEGEEVVALRASISMMELITV
jgi:hypothetical protein